MPEYARSTSAFPQPGFIIRLRDFAAHAHVYVELLGPQLISQVRIIAHADADFQSRIERLRNLLDAAAKYPDKPQYGEAATRALHELLYFLTRSVQLSDLVQPIADYRTALAADAQEQYCVAAQTDRWREAVVTWRSGGGVPCPPRRAGCWDPKWSQLTEGLKWPPEGAPRDGWSGPVLPHPAIQPTDIPPPDKLAAAAAATRQLYDQNGAARRAAGNYAACITVLNGRQGKLLELHAAIAALAPRYAAMRDSLAEVSKEWHELQDDVARCATGLKDS